MSIVSELSTRLELTHEVICRLNDEIASLRRQLAEARKPGPATADILSLVRDQVKPLPSGMRTLHGYVSVTADRHQWLRLLDEWEGR